MRSSKPRILLLAAAVLSTLVLTPGASEGARARVKATSNRTWDPDFRHILKGDKIIWKNPTGIDHTVTAYRQNWDKNTRLDPDERTSKRFRKTGTFKYRCRIHSTLSDGECSGMCGEIHVTK